VTTLNRLKAKLPHCTTKGEVEQVYKAAIALYSEEAPAALLELMNDADRRWLEIHRQRTRSRRRRKAVRP